MGTALAAPPNIPNLAWLPTDNGLVDASAGIDAISNTNIMIAGTVYLLKITPRVSFTASNIVVIVSTAGNNTGGSAGSFAGLYSSAGSLLSGSADTAALLTSTGAATLPLTTPQLISAGAPVWAAIVVNLGTTQPTLRGVSGSSPAAANALLSAASFRVAVNGTLQTSLPGSINPASNVSAGALPFWVGIS